MPYVHKHTNNLNPPIYIIKERGKEGDSHNGDKTRDTPTEAPAEGAEAAEDVDG